MRAWVERPRAAPGLFGLLAAPRLRAAVQVLLGCPERDWTVASLADLCHMSRATFARSFLRAAGAAPATVLTQLRMARAAQALLQQRGSTAEIAAAVGYHSEAAFNRGFKRVYGVGPGQFRREGARAAP
jgi:AraC family transcriptional activator of mtrCDE